MTDRVAVARRYFEEMWNRKDRAVADAIVAPDVVGHLGGRTVRGRDILHARLDFVDRTYTTSAFAIDDVIASGDRVCVRWTQRARHSGRDLGEAAEGKDVVVGGLHVFRIEDGRIAEIWAFSDDLGELAQLGLVKVPEGW